MSTAISPRHLSQGPSEDAISGITELFNDSNWQHFEQPHANAGNRDPPMDNSPIPSIMQAPNQPDPQMCPPQGILHHITLSVVISQLYRPLAPA